MGFTKGIIDYVDGKYEVTLYYSWMYVSETTKVETFDTLHDAEKWILNERTYGNLVISDAASSSLSYKDALMFQNKKKSRY